MRLVATLPLALLAGCDLGGRTTLEIDHFQTICDYGEYRTLCPRAREPGEEAYGGYAPITGFDPEWGHRYTIDIDVDRVLNPPMDAPGQTYRLIEILSEELVPTTETFALTLWAGLSEPDVTIREGDDFGSLLGARFSCADAAVCADARTELTVAEGEDPHRVELSFGYTDDYSLVLLDAIRVDP